MRKVPIEVGNLAKVLELLGSMYRNPAEAIKEHISNAIDEHLKARAAKAALPSCLVSFDIKKDRITIEYPYGMSEKEFRSALKRVADSKKRELEFGQIGQLGIGLFSFFQIGKQCTFISRKNEESETIKVTIREGSDEAEFNKARKKESLPQPGIKIIISQLLFDPTKSRGPLSPTRLQKVFAEKFTSYLQNGFLKIELRYPKKSYKVEPLKINLPSIAETYREWYAKGDAKRKIVLELYFDPSQKGTVGIRHTGVTIVDDISALDAYGLEKSIYATGWIKGFIEADFLKPLPARTGFEPNDDWLDFLGELDKLRPSIEAEVELFQEKEKEERLSEIQKKAIRLARDILDSGQFKDLELLEGLGPKTGEPRFPPNGFDFVPSSIRIDPGKIGILPLKAFVPKVIPDKSWVIFKIDNPSIDIKPKRAILRASGADENGVVTLHVSIAGKNKSKTPLILTAKTKKFQTEARIRIVEATQTRKPLTGKERRGSGINYEEIPFEEDPSRHSRYVSRVIQINTLNPDYKRIMQGGTDEEKLVYATLIIGKETIAFNDKTGKTDEFLEKLLSYLFQLKQKL